MDINFKEGLTNKMDFIVSHNETANSYGSGSLEVYATAAMIALMENTSMNCVQAGLPEGYTTVGIEVNIKHIKATAVGMKVSCETLLEKIEGKRLYFKVEAYDPKGKIGEGSHVRYIVNSTEFMNRLIK